MPKIKFEQFETLNTGFPTEIPDNHFSDTLNMIRREDGLWENRKGIVQFGENVGSGEPIHSLRFWKTTSNRYLTVGTDTDVYSYAEGAAYNDGAYTNRKTLSSDAQWDSIVYRDTIVIGNGVTGLYSSTDNATFTTRTASASIAAAKFLEVGNDFVSFSGISGDPDKVALSSGAPASPWTFNSSNLANIDIGNSDEITAMKTLGQVLVVCKTRQTYTVALTDFSRQTIDWAGGTESNRAILQTQLNSLFVAGRQGIFDLSKTQIGSNQIFGSPESALIKSLYDLVTDYTDINGLYTFKENYVMWNCETSLGRLTFIRNLDYSNPVWSYFTGINSKDWTIYLDADGNEHYLFADGSSDKIYELFSGRSDNGAPILSRLATKRTDLGAPGEQKYIHYVDIFGYISRNALWTVKIYRDDESLPIATYTIDQTNITTPNNLIGLGTSSLGTRPLGGIINNIDDVEVFPFEARVSLEQDFEKIQVVLENNQAGARVILRSISMDLEKQPTSLFRTVNYL
jgi:hypothetical protein